MLSAEIPETAGSARDSIARWKEALGTLPIANVQFKINNGRSLVSAEEISEDIDRNIGRRELDEDMEGWEIDLQSDEDVMDFFDSVVPIE